MALLFELQENNTNREMTAVKKGENSLGIREKNYLSLKVINANLRKHIVLKYRQENQF